jgi:hypothetical protein
MMRPVVCSDWWYSRSGRYFASAYQATSISRSRIQSI